MADSRFAQERHPHLQKMRERLAKQKREDALIAIADEEAMRERWKRWGRNMSYEEAFLDEMIAREKGRYKSDDEVDESQDG